ncbi:hypothetical protein [Bacillus sp. AFS017274]|uniref:hypothetical protein n=1 Tax=Bacillus sp. AFS017274 TaxID=2033488 RepID=UPI0015CF37F6|nr:hypothetical protein [Bacillus sp. AFS017274]
MDKQFNFVAGDWELDASDLEKDQEKDEKEEEQDKEQELQNINILIWKRSHLMLN